MSFQQCPAATATEVPPSGRGEACSISLSQDASDPGGQTIEVYASGADGSLFIGQFVVTSPAHRSRIAAFAAIPGAQLWRVIVSGGPASSDVPLEVAVWCGPARAYAPLTLVSP